MKQSRSSPLVPGCACYAGILLCVLLLSALAGYQSARHAVSTTGRPQSLPVVHDTCPTRACSIVCEPDAQYMTKAMTTTTHRECANLTVCDAASQYEPVPHTTTSDRKCAVTATYVLCMGRWVVWTGLCRGRRGFTPVTQSDTETSHRSHVFLRHVNDFPPFRRCTASQWIKVQATPTSNRVCANWTVCNTTAPKEVEIQKPSELQDRLCRPCVGFECGCSTCESVEFITARCTETTGVRCH